MKDYYKQGYEKISCFNCGEDIEVTCNEKGEYSILKEEAYCNNCNLLHVRGRDTIIERNKDSIFDFQPAEDHENYEEYNCKYCNNKHEKTKPTTSKFEVIKTVIRSNKGHLELRCQCGERTEISQLVENEIINCQNCKRKITLSSENKIERTKNNKISPAK